VSVAKLAPTFSNRARPESRRFVSRLGHGALACLASDPPASGRLGELRDKFLYVSSSVLNRAVPTLWHAFMFLGLRFFPLFFFLFVASTSFSYKKICFEPQHIAMSLLIGSPSLNSLQMIL
jgi:hypothetical protein